MATLIMRRHDNLKAEHKAPITEDCYMDGKLLDGMNCRILLDTGASRSFMSKRFDQNFPSLHSLPKFALKTKTLLVGNGQHVSVLFVIPVMID